MTVPINNIDCLEKINQSNNSKNEENENLLTKIFLNDKTKKCFLLSIYFWSVDQLLFYETLINLDKFEESIKHASNIFFLSHMIANIIIPILINYLGLRSCLSKLSYLSLMSLILLVIIKQSFDSYLTTSSLFFIFNIVATGIGESIYILIPTLFESNIRSTACSYSKIPSKLILIVAPFFIFESTLSIYFIFIILIALIPVLLMLLEKLETF